MLRVTASITIVDDEEERSVTLTQEGTEYADAVGRVLADALMSVMPVARFAASAAEILRTDVLCQTRMETE